MYTGTFQNKDLKQQELEKMIDNKPDIPGKIFNTAIPTTTAPLQFTNEMVWPSMEPWNTTQPYNFRQGYRYNDFENEAMGKRYLQTKHL